MEFLRVIICAVAALYFVWSFTRKRRISRRVSGGSRVMSLVTGIGEDMERIDIAAAYAGTCTRCGSTEPGALFLEYRCFSALWLFSLATEKCYYRRCADCGQDDVQDRRMVEGQFGRTKIRSNNLLGFGIVFGTLLAIFIFGMAMYSD